MNLDLLSLASPLPTLKVDKNTGHKEITDGFLIKTPNYCLKKCKTKNCAEFINQQASDNITHNICDNGFSTFLLRFDTDNLLIAGVIAENNREIKGERRRAYHTHIINRSVVESWYKGALKLKLFIEEGIPHIVADSIAELHDVKSTASVVTRNAEAVIKDYSAGKSFEDKVESASPILKTLYKSVMLLNSRLNMMSIITNPASVTHGSRRRFPVLKIFYKIAKIFEGEASSKRVNINVVGSSTNAPDLYPAFDTIPLVLIDNAVKYSLSDQGITVRIDDVGNGVKASVTSFGPIVSQDEISKIFEKGYRSAWAVQTISKGSGLGLYIAKLVADAHNTKIMYYNKPSGNTVSGKKVGENTFEVNIQ